MRKNVYVPRGYAAPSTSAKRQRTVAYKTSMVRASPRLLARRAVSQETGFVDLTAASYDMNTTGTVTLLATVPQGTSVNTRVGKKIRLKGLQGRGSMNSNSAAAANDVSFLIVYDKRPTGSLPVVTDILVSANSNSMNNDANSGRFRILKRVDCTLNGSTSLGITSNTQVSADFYLDLKGLPVEYEAAGTGAIADISLGALYLVTVGSITAGTSAAILLMGFRTRFLDM